MIDYAPHPRLPKNLFGGQASPLPRGERDGVRGRRKGGFKMSIQKKYYLWMLMIFTCLIIALGCSSPPKTLDRSVSGPQLIVNPETIRLAVSKLKVTDIVFEGSGFKPGDSIFITMTGPKETKVIMAEAPIKPDGTFKAKVADLTKFMEIMRADIKFNEKFQSVVVITQPPIPEGVYKAIVTSMLSTLTAETKFEVKGPTVIDRLKDWIGKLTGKIEHKKAK